MGIINKLKIDTDLNLKYTAKNQMLEIAGNGTEEDMVGLFSLLILNNQMFMRIFIKVVQAVFDVNIVFQRFDTMKTRIKLDDKIKIDGRD